MVESKFERDFIKEIQELFPKAIVLKNDANYLQGFPDRLILFDNGVWAALEFKKSDKASRRVNQEYYITILNEMSYASFVSPENKEQVIDELQETYRINRASCIPVPFQIPLDKLRFGKNS